MLHKNIVASDVHVMCTWLYANAAARTGASGFVAGDIGKSAWQQDDDTFWVLKATTPTWAQIGALALGKGTGAEVNAGTEDTHYVTAKAIADSNVAFLSDIPAAINVFQNVAVAGQTTVTSDNTNDTLTLIAGTNITLTTNAATDEITIAAAGGGGSAVTVKNESVSITTAVTSIDFVGAGVTATNTGDAVTVTIDGGAGGGAAAGYSDTFMLMGA